MWGGMEFRERTSPNPLALYLLCLFQRIKGPPPRPSKAPPKQLFFRGNKRNQQRVPNPFGGFESFWLPLLLIDSRTTYASNWGGGPRPSLIPNHTDDGASFSYQIPPNCVGRRELVEGASPSLLRLWDCWPQWVTSGSHSFHFPSFLNFRLNWLGSLRWGTWCKEIGWMAIVTLFTSRNENIKKMNYFPSKFRRTNNQKQITKWKLFFTILVKWWGAFIVYTNFLGFLLFDDICLSFCLCFKHLPPQMLPAAAAAVPRPLLFLNFCPIPPLIIPLIFSCAMFSTLSSSFSPNCLFVMAVAEQGLLLLRRRQTRGERAVVAVLRWQGVPHHRRRRNSNSNRTKAVIRRGRRANKMQ